MTPLTPRLLRRSGKAMPPLLWRLAHGSPTSDVVAKCIAAGADCFYLPHEGSDPPRPLPDAARIVLGIEADALRPRRSAVVEDRLKRLGRTRCDAVMLSAVSGDEVKAGGPFHRLSQLRDRGVIDLFFVDAPDHAAAEWMLHHTPAHAIAIPFSLDEQTPKYRILPDALGFGTGLLARTTRHDAENISFLAAEDAVTSILLPVPDSAEELQAIVEAFRRPMGQEACDEHWRRFKAVVPEPEKPKRGEVPE